jgi:hypothetical protein
LVHSLERRRAGRAYRVSIELRRFASASIGTPGILPAGTLNAEVSGPRVFIIGTGERVDLATPPGLLPRHIALLTIPYAEGVQIRALSLHPDRGLVHLRGDRPPPTGQHEPGELDQDDDDDRPGMGATLSTTVGGVVAYNQLQAMFEGHLLEVNAVLERNGDGQPEAPRESASLAKGEQLAFYNGAAVRPVGNVLASVGGPEGGGFAVPALVAHTPEALPEPGSLVLRSRGGVHRLEPPLRDLRRGVLIGRSRRCVLGRGFDENDGLSRLHALVLLVEDGVWAFDLASRYGLRDVARPNRLISCARLDDGVGCLVYGAGHLLYER